MKIFVLTLFSLINLTGFCFAQQETLPLDKGLEKHQVLFVLRYNDNPEIKAFRLITKEGRNDLFNGNNISDIKVVSPDSAVKLFGVEGVNGALIIKLRWDIFKKMVNTNDLLAKFNIADKDRKYPIYVDSSFCSRPAMYYYELKKIKSVKVDQTNSGINFINILTVPSKQKLNTDIYIRGTYTIPDSVRDRIH